MPRIKALLLLFLLLALFTASCSQPLANNSLSPSLMVKLSLEELVDQSDWIATGTITACKSVWDENRINIYTHYTFAVEEWFKGDSEEGMMIIMVPGGKVGLTSQRVEDAVKLTKGERALLFLSCNEDGTCAVVGGSQGKFADAAGDEERSGTSMTETVSKTKELLN